MRITYIVNAFPKISETFILDQITRLIDSGYDISIIAALNPNEPVVHDSVEKYGLIEKTHYVRQSSRHPGFEITPEFIDTILFSDLIHAHFATWPAETAMYIAKMAKIPFIFTAHAYDIFINPDTGRLIRMAENASKIIMVSEFNKNYILGLIGNAYADKIEIIKYAIDIEQFSPVEKVASDKVRVLICARLVEKKGIPYAIKAFSKVSNKFNAELRIIGDGPMKQEIKDLIEELHLHDHVKLLGAQKRSFIVNEMRQADIFLLPSITAQNGDSEGLPVSLLEAEAMSLPVVSSFHTGIPEGVLDGETGFLVPEKDIDGLSVKLETLVKNPALRIEMGRKGREFIKTNFNVKTEIEDLGNIIHDSVKETNRVTGLSMETQYILKLKIMGLVSALASQKEARVNQLAEQLVKKTEEVKKLQERVKTRDEQLGQKDARVNQLAEQLVKKTEEVKKLEERVNTRDEQLSEKDARVNQLTERLERKTEEVRKLEGRVKIKEQQLTRVQGEFLNSMSWRITSPLRHMLDLLVQSRIWNRRANCSAENVSQKKTISSLAESVSQRLPKILTKSSSTACFSFHLPPLVGTGNDYTFIEKKLRDTLDQGLTYHKAVSFIIPVYNRKAILEKTLAALTHQTYPRELMEVIIADDGSSDGVEEVIEKFKTVFDISHVKQEDKGYRLSAIRNKGIESAKYDYVILLDCDMLPVPELAEEYMKWHHVADDVVLLGHRRFVNTDTLTSDDILENIDSALSLPDVAPVNDSLNPSGLSEPMQDWRLSIYEKTDFLKREPFCFRVLCGGNVCISRKDIEAAGYFDENFVKWGCEDQEFAFRLYQLGLYFVPLLSATGLHQEHLFTGSRKKDQEENLLILEQKIPVSLYRKYTKDRSYEVPKVSVYIPAYNAERFIKQAVDSVLNQTYTDLEVCICNDGSTDDTVGVLEKNYSNNPKVRWVTIPNGGIGKASNAAVRMCRGAYIGQLDSDDMLLPHAVETCVKYLDRHHDVGCVYGTYERIDENGFITGAGYNWPEFSRVKLLNNMIVHHFRVFRKCDWSRTEGFNETFENAVDYDMYVRLSEVCRFHHINDVLYQYRTHGENTSVKKSEAQTRNTYEVVNYILKKYNLDRTWELYAGESNPRNVRFRKKNIQAAAAPKGDHEMAYWRKCKEKEGKLSNSHYEYFYTAHFGLDVSFYKGKRILDIGCGPRGSLEWADMALERVGLDPLADRYRELGIGRLAMNYVAAPSENMPFPEGCFDVVCSFNSLDHVNGLDKTIKEIIRVMKPCGMFLLLTDVNHTPTACEPIEFSWDIVGRFEPALKVMEQRHYEKTGGIYESVRAGVPYDHSNKDNRCGVLSARFENKGIPDKTVR